MTRTHAFTISKVALFLFSLTESSSAVGPYSVTDLGELFRAEDPNIVWNISSYGQATGFGLNVQPFQSDLAFLWSPTSANGTIGTSYDLGLTPGSINSFGVGINSSGQVSGITHAFTTEGSFVWTPDSPNGTSGAMLALTAPPGRGPSSNAFGINDSGQIVGHAYASVDTMSTAVMWIPTAPDRSTYSPIDLTPDCINCFARDINSQGQIAGARQTSPRGSAVMSLWTPDAPNGTAGSWVDITGLGTANSFTTMAINDYGQIVVGSRLWTPSTANGSSGTVANLDIDVHDINSQGIIVGDTIAPVNTQRALIWVPDSVNGSVGTSLELSSLLEPVSGAGWTILHGTAINDAGQIVARGLLDPDGPGGVAAQQRSVLLTPVPEPSTLFLLAVGAIGLLGCRNAKSRG